MYCGGLRARNMAKLTDVYRAEDVIDVGYRQIPVVTGSADDSSLMVSYDNCQD